MYSPVEPGNLFIYACPPGFCQCYLNTSVGDSSCINVYTNSDPNLQCGCNRKGNESLREYYISDYYTANNIQTVAKKNPDRPGSDMIDQSYLCQVCLQV